LVHPLPCKESLNRSFHVIILLVFLKSCKKNSTFSPNKFGPDLDNLKSELPWGYIQGRKKDLGLENWNYSDNKIKTQVLF
jgi:hypothetical protein